MKKLTRAEIQSLSDNELNFYLYMRVPGYDETERFRPDDKHNFVNSLDAQFELAEKFDLPFEVTFFPSHFTFRVNSIKYPLHTQTKRTGAELLLEAIQELEAVK